MARLVTVTAAHKAAATRKRIIVFPPCECVGTVLVLAVGEPRTWSRKSSSAQGNIREGTRALNRECPGSARGKCPDRGRNALARPGTALAGPKVPGRSRQYPA